LPGIDQGPVGNNHARFLQGAHSTQTGRRRKADPFSQILVADPALGLKHIENPSIESI
jgi:hypothetical protein